MTQTERIWQRQSEQYRAFVRTLNEGEFENERFTVLVEWSAVADEYKRRYPALEREDFFAILGF